MEPSWQDGWHSQEILRPLPQPSAHDTPRNWKFPMGVIWEKEGLKPLSVRGEPCLLGRDFPQFRQSVRPPCRRDQTEMGGSQWGADRTALRRDLVMHTGSPTCIPKLDLGWERSFCFLFFSLGHMEQLLSAFQPPLPWSKMSL